MGTLVFDEIDANVGGRLGDVLGQKLAALGRSHQVICVTHLAPVASFARHHWTIRKEKVKNRTVTRIHALASEDERLEEILPLVARHEAAGIGLANGQTCGPEAQPQPLRASAGSPPAPLGGAPTAAPGRCPSATGAALPAGGSPGRRPGRHAPRR